MPFPIDFILDTEWGGRRNRFRKSLSLVDHAGGALKGTTDQDIAKQHSQVLDDLKSADAFVAFLSTEHLLNGTNAERDSDWQTMCEVIDAVSEKIHPEDRVPVTIVLSKYDLAQDSGREQEVFDKAKEIVKHFSRTKENVTFMICPINVVRKDRKNNYIPDPNPHNLAAPFLFTASGVIMRNAKMLQYFADEQQSRSASLQDDIEHRLSENAGFFGFFRRIIPNIKAKFEMSRYDESAKRHIKLSHVDISFSEKAFTEIGLIADTGSICFVHGGVVISSANEYLKNVIRPYRYA